MEESSIVTFVIEWIWVPAYAGLAVLFRLLAKLWSRQTASEQITDRRLSLLEQANIVAADQRGQILSQLNAHNDGVIEAIGNVHDDLVTVIERHETRINSIEDSLRAK